MLSPLQLVPIQPSSHAWKRGLAIVGFAWPTAFKRSRAAEGGGSLRPPIPGSPCSLRPPLSEKAPRDFGGSSSCTRITERDRLVVRRSESQPKRPTAGSAIRFGPHTLPTSIPLIACDGCFVLRGSLPVPTTSDGRNDMISSQRSLVSQSEIYTIRQYIDRNPTDGSEPNFPDINTDCSAPWLSIPSIAATVHRSPESS